MKFFISFALSAIRSKQIFFWGPAHSKRKQNPIFEFIVWFLFWINARAFNRSKSFTLLNRKSILVVLFTNSFFFTVCSCCCFARIFHCSRSISHLRAARCLADDCYNYYRYNFRLCLGRVANKSISMRMQTSLCGGSFSLFWCRTPPASHPSTALNRCNDSITKQIKV